MPLPHRDTRALYYVSDNSYGYLIMLAEIQGYVKSNHEKARGMSEFFNDLSKCKFHDARPTQVLKRHDYEIRTHRAPLWTSHYIRKTRALTLSSNAKENYVILARNMGIIKNEPFIIGGPKRLSYCSIIGYVLEAMGLRWITIDTLPMKATGVLVVQ